MGGPRGPTDAPRPGLLGADYAIDHDRYRFAKIYNGQNWTPSLSAPLTLPGINVVEGDYLLAVNGRELHGSDNIESFLDGTAGKQTVLRIAKAADGAQAREVTVVPVVSEYGLRNVEWINANRRKVDELSGGKVAYVYMPNTAGAGYTNFNRYFYAQLDRQALVLDERYNQGGLIADYIVLLLSQKHLSNAIERDGSPVHDPQGAIFGPKAMIINQNAGSGGDAMPWYFRKAGLGPLVGKRTWGGLVGIGGYPALIDGGAVHRAPLRHLRPRRGLGSGRQGHRARCRGRGTAEGHGGRARCAARTRGRPRPGAAQGASPAGLTAAALPGLPCARRARFWPLKSLT